MDKTNVMVEFVISGDELVPNEMTNKLNLLPSRFWMKGDQIPGTSRKKLDTCWILETDYEESYDINDQLSKIVALIADKKDILQEIQVELNVEYMFMIVVKVENERTPAMYFQRDFITFCDEIKAEIHFDLYVNCRDSIERFPYAPYVN